MKEFKNLKNISYFFLLIILNKKILKLIIAFWFNSFLNYLFQFSSSFKHLVWTFSSNLHILNKTNFSWWMIRVIVFEELLIIWILIVHKVLYLLWWWFDRYNNWLNLQDKLACVINWCDKSNTSFKKHYYHLYHSKKYDQIFAFWRLVNSQHLRSESLNRKRICSQQAEWYVLYNKSFLVNDFKQYFFWASFADVCKACHYFLHYLLWSLETDSWCHETQEFS